KLVVLVLAAPKPILLPVTPVQKDPETPILEIPRVPKMRRTARISVKQIWRQFPEGVITKRGPSIATTKEKVVINDSSDSETRKKVEDDNMELIAMDEPFVQVEEVEEEEGRKRILKRTLKKKKKKEKSSIFMIRKIMKTTSLRHMTTLPTAPLGAIELQDAKTRA
ncbi:hypothetical protein PIB30_092306, partial [Stylosanthes scabra]|nr:hypothetical protein [Stylosanthes scabra]